MLESGIMTCDLLDTGHLKARLREVILCGNSQFLRNNVTQRTWERSAVVCIMREWLTKL